MLRCVFAHAFETKRVFAATHRTDMRENYQTQAFVCVPYLFSVGTFIYFQQLVFLCALTTLEKAHFHRYLKKQILTHFLVRCGTGIYHIYIYIYIYIHIYSTV
jgi:hypothetical protein